MPQLAPDAIRKLAKTFKDESTEVKHQALSLGLKVWSYHFYKLQDLQKQKKNNDIDDLLNTSQTPKQNGGISPQKGEDVDEVEQARTFVRRLDGIFDYVCAL